MSPIFKRSVRLFLILTLIFIIITPFSTVEAGGGGWEVNTVDDLDDGLCDPSHCSLREAINIANATAGTQMITFDIPGGGPHIIELCNALPDITDPIIINGIYEPHYPYMGGPVVAITPGTGPTCTPPAYGLWVETGDADVEGMSIAGFDQPGAPVSGGIIYHGGSGGLVQDNYIGLLPGGIPSGNYNGIVLGTDGHTLRGNVISGNTYGVHVLQGGNYFYENRIGTDPVGMSTSPNHRNTIGIYIEAGADSNTIGWNGSGNVISGNGDGIYLASQGNQIKGNLIGTDLPGLTALGNSIGIHAAEATYTIIGSPEPGDRNLISGNIIGISIGGYSTVQNNFIGTDISGTEALPNQVGLSIQSASYNLIGGTGTNQGNVISGNSSTGIALHDFTTHIEIVSNLIGTDVTGMNPLGNGQGIAIQGSGNFVGHVATGGGNTIAYNTNEGVLLFWSAADNAVEVNTIHDNGVGIYLLDETNIYNSFTQNSIYDNAALGIDHTPWGVNPNDVGDGDSGANTLRNFPEFTDADTTFAEGAACPGCTVEVYLADNDPSGYGEGETLLGTTTAGPAGDFNFIFPSTLSACDRITATATDASGNTSEFSLNKRVGLCFTLDPSWFFLIEITFFIIPWFAVFTAGRRRGRPAGQAAGIGAAVGLAAAAGVFGLERALPAVQINPPAAESPDAAGVLPPCEAFLTPGSLLPSEGAVGMPEADAANLTLSWLPLGSVGDDGEHGDILQWQVDLILPTGELVSQETAEQSLALSAFGVEPDWFMDDGEGDDSGALRYDGVDGEAFFWRVTGLGLTDAGEMQPLCQPTNWLSFQLGVFEALPELPWLSAAPPAPAPEPEEEPTEETCTPAVTATMNLTCRYGPTSEYEERGYLLTGETALVEGRNAEGTWWYIPNPDWQDFCWIWDGGVETDCIPDDLLVIIPPPLPEPTSVCRIDLDRTACNEAGGTFVPGGATAADTCQCP